MGCNCRKQRNANKVPDSITEAKDIDLPRCYECAKKHLSRAKEEFKEYHTGYPQHVKNLIQSSRAAESDIRGACLKWMEIQAQLDMSSGELLGRDVNGSELHTEHIQLANKIREERIKFNDNPFYIPQFDELLLSIHVLEYRDL